MKRLIFTGERMIPELNKGKALYYEHILRYFLAASFVKGKTVLDLACGTGYGSRILSLSGAKSITGVDLSEDVIRYAQKNFKTKNVKFVKGDVLDLSFLKETFNMIVAFEILEHLKSQEEFLSQAKSKLKKDGLFLISTPNKINYPRGNPFHQKELSLSEFEKLLKNKFKHVEVVGQFFVLTNLLLARKSQKEELNLSFDKFNSANSKFFFSPLKGENAQYFLAICSDKKIKNLSTVSLSVPKVDNIDFLLGPSLVDNKLIEMTRVQALSPFQRIIQAFMELGRK